LYDRVWVSVCGGWGFYQRTQYLEDVLKVAKTMAFNSQHVAEKPVNCAL
jgi:hypothetical protein